MGSTFSVILVISACIGLLMIVGGMFLMYKGVITLQATPKTEALTVRWRKQFVLTTQVPALGFFLIGLAFVVFAMWFAKPVPDSPLRISGNVSGVQSPIKVSVRSEPGVIERDITDNNPSFTGTVYPNLHTLVLDVTAPGYGPHQESFNEDKWLSNHSIDLGAVNLTKLVSESQPNPGDIEPIPFQPPPQSSEGTYGVTP